MLFIKIKEKKIQGKPAYIRIKADEIKSAEIHKLLLYASAKDHLEYLQF
jgi:hypothetical protein